MKSSGQEASRIAVVTGGARGIGAAIARRLAADGLDIAVVDLDEASCVDTVSAVHGYGRRCVAVAADVSDEHSVAAAVERIHALLGPPTVLVNNAGLLRERTIGKTTVEDWDAVIQVNLRSAFLMCRALISHMRAAKWGRIVNVSSTGARGGHGLASYSSAKAGVQGLTRTLAIELGRYGITANAVAPGFVATAMTAGVAERIGMSLEEMKRQVLRDIPVGRVGVPEDIANAVAFFVDERSSFVSGQIIYVDGGSTA